MSPKFIIWAIVCSLVTMVFGFDENTELIMLGIIASYNESCEQFISAFTKIRYLLISSVTSFDLPMATLKKNSLICFIICRSY